ncbi:MAG: hypothetical protein KC646_04155 [Candidatus Cloacimonetes bacterium]|nr:hypothetical protein [Candidatus Cloacimonadota bacterium]
MVDIQYDKVSKEQDNPAILLSSKAGSYFYQSVSNKNSRFEGLYTMEPNSDGWNMYKSLDRVQLMPIAETLQFIGAVPMVHYSDTSSVRYFLLDSGVLSIKLQNYFGSATISLDPREIYDFEDCSRVITQVGEQCEDIVSFRCDINGTTPYSYFVSVYCKQEFKFDSQALFEDHYPLESMRNSTPDKWSTHGCLEVDFCGDGTLYFTSGTSKELSESRLKSVLKDRSDQLRVSIHNNQQFDFNRKSSSDLHNQAFQSAKISLESLKVDHDVGGIYAGLPWFFHWWSRDEAISLGALIELKQYDYVKSLLIKQCSNFLDDGRVSCRFPKMDLASADSTGWCATRLFQLIHLQSNLFTKQELQSLYDIFTHQVTRIEQNFLKDDLIISHEWETWMDTGDHRDKRDGFLIEIQVLHQRIHDLIALLATHLDIKAVKIDRISVIKDSFFHNFLYDRIDPHGKLDSISRPNLFICYYIYHQLLTRDEWEKCFDHIIPDLWLEWGGFASIEIGSELYQESYTGETNESYHRGDSWYYINNMAALCLKHLNYPKYKKYVDTILDASSNEIVFMGASGHHAEVSSAKVQESQGCLSQAWSASMYIELFNSLS